MKPVNRSIVILRITALWAFTESFLGGILHGFKLPFAGLFLSLVAALCMALIASVGSVRGQIIKATLVVITIKFMLSPHTPPMAYLAVMIQGLAGELFFMSRRFLPLKTFMLTVFCLIYSAFQHLLVLTILFGREFWEAIDIFLNGITKNFIKEPQYYSLYLVISYLGTYLLAGILGGFMNQRIVARIQKGNVPDLPLFTIDKIQDLSAGKQQKKKSPFGKFILPVLLLMMLVLSYTPMFSGTVLRSKAIAIFTRGLLVFLAWKYLLTPLLTYWVQKWMSSYQEKNKTYLKNVLALLPDMKSIIRNSWKASTGKNKIKQLFAFLFNTVLLLLYEKK